MRRCIKGAPRSSVASTAMIALTLASCAATSSNPGTADTNSNLTNATTNVAVPQNAIQEDLESTYSKLAREGGKLFTIAPQSSSVRIFAFRAGAAAKLGHNHVLSAPQFTGYYYLPSTGPAGSRFDLQFKLDQLTVDNPADRAPLGGAFATVPTREAIEGTREHMLGSDGLQAQQFPFVSIHSIQIAGEAPEFAAKIGVTLHGQTHEQWVPLHVAGLPDKLSVSGAMVLRQSDYGIKPYSVMGGMLAVQDEIVIEFKLVAN